jgi:DNA/RNA-binding domain of Phe-tRNA-synthetase-like protein
MLHISKDVYHKYGIKLYYALVDAQVKPSIKFDVSHILKKYGSLESLKDNKIVRAYRDFYWRIGIDPTKQRPSAEALIRRAFKGNFPKINTVVDAGNLASAEYCIPIGIYQMENVRGIPILRLSKGGEEFLPIGGKLKILKEGTLIIADEEKVLHVYPYRDSQYTMVKKDGRFLVVACGVPNVPSSLLIEVIDRFLKLAEEWCNAKTIEKGFAKIV